MPQPSRSSLSVCPPRQAHPAAAEIRFARSSITDLRFTPLLTTEVQAVLERHGYRLPPGSDHLPDLVLARVDIALKNLVEIYEGRIW